MKLEIKKPILEFLFSFLSLKRVNRNLAGIQTSDNTTEPYGIKHSLLYMPGLKPGPFSFPLVFS